MKRLFFVSAVVLAVMSCSKDGEVSSTIRVKVTSEDTKGTVTTTTGLELSGVFSMDVFVAEDYSSTELSGSAGKYVDCAGSGNVTLDAGSWAIAGEPVWLSGTPLRFWAWHPVSTEGERVIVGPGDGSGNAAYDGEKLSFKYTTPEADGESDATNGEDLIFAHATQSFNGTNNVVNLTFQHALAQILFCVSTTDGTFDPSLGISNISITGLKNYGEALFANVDGENDFIWSGQTGSETFGQDYNASFKTLPATGWKAGKYTAADDTKYDLHTTENVFFMIPQALTKTANTVKVTFVSDGDEITKEIKITDDSGDEWLADHYYRYKIKATIVGRDIEASVSLESWSDRDEKIFI